MYINHKYSNSRGIALFCCRSYIRFPFYSMWFMVTWLSPIKGAFIGLSLKQIKEEKKGKKKQQEKEEGRGKKKKKEEKRRKRIKKLL